MPGGPTVDQTWVYRFHDILNLTYQQKGSLLENLIDPMYVHRGVNAAIDHFDRLGNLMANDVINPFGQTKILNPGHSRRAVTLISSDAAVLVSDENNLRAMINPQNAYTNTIVYALGRRADKHIIDAANGSATTAAVTTGSGVITYGTQAMLGNHVIGDANAWDLTRTIAGNEILSKSGVPSGAGRRKLLYSPGQLRDILAITQASSSDFTKNQIHDRGTINGLSWEGYDWIEIADVVDVDTSLIQNMLNLTSPTQRQCLAIAVDAMGLAIGLDITTKVSMRPDLNDSIQVRSHIMMASGRIFDGGVVQIDAKEN